MASIRQLPSDRWQASVLLDSGRRNTSTFDTLQEARDWAIEQEVERDRRREELRSQRDEDHVPILLSQLERLAKDGRLTDDDIDQLHSIVRVARVAQFLLEEVE